MRMLLTTCFLAAAIAAPALADDNDGPKAANKHKMKFWNLTGVELVEVVLAPAGTDKFSANQTENDDGNGVDTDERVELIGIAAGKYDVRVKDKSGRTCLVKDIDVKDTGPYSFSLESDQLTDCKS